MAAPNVSGKYVSTTTGMNVNDYIKCVYEAPDSGTAGYFSQLGTKEPYMLTITTETVNGIVEKDHEVTKTNYTELSTGVPSTTPSGFFYLIKLDQGFLVADRMVQWGVTWAKMNEKNYIYGAVFNCEDARTVEYIDKVTTTKVWEDGDPTTNDAGVETLIEDEFNDIKKRYKKYERTSVEITTKQIEESVQKTQVNPETNAEEPVVDESGNPVMETITKTVNDKLLTTITTRTKYWAKVPDNVTRIVNTIPAQLEIPYEIEPADLENLLSDITEVTCTIQDSNDEAQQIQVAIAKDSSSNLMWDISNYDKKSKTNQVVTGTLEDLEASVTPIRNPNEIKAACTLIIKLDQLVAITSTFNDVIVTSDIDSVALSTKLSILYPTCEISVKKYGQNDSEAVIKTGFDITWNTDDYIAGMIGEQTISGTIQNLDSYGIENDILAFPSVKVITNPI